MAELFLWKYAKNKPQQPEMPAPPAAPPPIPTQDTAVSAVRARDRLRRRKGRASTILAGDSISGAPPGSRPVTG